MLACTRTVRIIPIFTFAFTGFLVLYVFCQSVSQAEDINKACKAGKIRQPIVQQLFKTVKEKNPRIGRKTHDESPIIRTAINSFFRVDLGKNSDPEIRLRGGGPGQT